MSQVNAPLPVSKYYSGQGRVMLGERDPATGRPKFLRQVGNCTALQLAMAVTSTDHKESMSGDRTIDLQLVTDKAPTINVTMESLSQRNLALGYWGNTITVAGGDEDAEPLVLVPGGVYPLLHPNISDLVLTKPGAPGAVLAELNNYDWDPRFGTIYVKEDPADVGIVPAGLAVTAAYTYAGYEKLEGLTEQRAPERFLRFEGLNTVDGAAVIVEVYRVQFQPLQTRDLINDEIANVALTGAIMADPRIATTGISRYFREIALDAA